MPAYLGGKDKFLANQLAILLCNALYALITSILFTTLAQTPGYKAQQIYLISLKTGRKLSFSQALLRYFYFIVAGSSVFGLLLFLFRKDRLNLHDILSKSAAVAKKA